MSILNVNKINPVGGGSTVTIAGIASVTNNISVGNSVTASSFHGNLTGTATGLNGTPNISVGTINGTSATITGGMVSAQNSGAGSGSSQIQLQPYGTDGYINCTASNNLYTRMGTGFTIRTRIDGSGNFTVNSGNLVIGTAGKGIDFSAQTASSLSGVSVSSELLDHYEEGTFTPTFGASNGSSTAGYSIQNGKYTRIGNIVHVQIYIALSSLSTNSHSHAWISGLPVAPVERTATSSIICGGMQNSGYTSFPIAARTGAGATRIELFQATNGGVTDFSTSSVSGTAYFILQCTYRAN